MTRGQAIVYFDKYLEVFGRDKVEVEYLRIATTLLSHPYYGAEATTKYSFAQVRSELTREIC
ncbi:hypothetical protein H6G81_13975 [Scytonema hofmannii FACHB-248]|uniref:Uncharacterized protein n=1 Tax=Scytonema hofmannii FACHB-248 TaxID=1842502 RepID=A0ABR8GQ83_9CYAN|nr:hypothetical protein [[Scytonema hofmanni] UTEX B 1581]MBD2605606.1 hypothetical protein [Scytonema hofmannii FACHB-248]